MKYEELYHHGIKGQKWGKRNGPPYPLNYSSKSTAEKKAISNKQGGMTKEQKDKLKRNVKIGFAVAGVTLAAIGGLYLYKQANMPLHVTAFKYGQHIDISSLSNQRRILEKGTKFQRISSKSIEDYGKIGRAYVSRLAKDNALYKKEIPEILKESIGAKEFYTLRLKAKKDIVVASEKEIVAAYAKICKVKDVDMGRFQRFMTDTIIDENDDLGKQFFEELRSKGINAIPDLNDIGWSKDPLILIDPQETVQQMSSKKLTKFGRFIATFVV